MKADLIFPEDLGRVIPHASVISLAGAGGKTTLMFRLSGLLAEDTVVTTTTKVGAGQIVDSDLQLTCDEFPPDQRMKSIWVSPSLLPVNGKISGCSLSEFSKLAVLCKANNYALINEADGAACRHIKAPADHEPVLPPETDVCIYLAGLDVLGSTVNNNNVHRPELFSAVTGADPGEIITAEHIIRLYDHPLGGLKNMPKKALRIAYLTHADTPERVAAGQYIADALKNYDFICLRR